MRILASAGALSTGTGTSTRTGTLSGTNPRNPRHFGTIEGGRLHNRERPLTWTFRAVLALLRGAVVSWLAFSFSAVAGFHWFSALGLWIETEQA